MNRLRRLTHLLLMLVVLVGWWPAALMSAQQSISIAISYAADSALQDDVIQVHLHSTFRDAGNGRVYDGIDLPGLGSFQFENDALKGYTTLVALPAGATAAIASIEGGQVIVDGAPFSAAATTDVNQAALLVGEPFWLRDQWVVRLKFLPVRWDQANNAMIVMDDITVRLTLTSDWPKPEPPRYDPKFEAIYRSALVNYLDGRSWRRAAPAQTDLASGPAPLPTAGNWRLHIRPQQSGLQRISGSDLLNAGIAISQTNPANLQLYWRSTPVPCRILGAEDGILDPEDTIIFYAAPWNFKYDNLDSYWLIPSNAPGSRVASVTHDPTGIAIDSFEETVRQEQQKIYYSNLPLTDQGDHWFWEIIRPGRTQPASKELSFNLAPMPSGPVRASLRLHAFSTESGKADVTLWLNNYRVTSLLVQGATEITIDQDFPHFILHEGLNTARLEISKNNGETNTFVLDWVELTYVRRMQASGDNLSFSVNWPGPWLLQLAGFSTLPEIWDVTEPSKPVRIAEDAIHANGDGTLQFASAGENSLEYAAAVPAVMSSPQLHLDPLPTQNLRLPQQADYLIITHPDFVAAANELAAWRQQQGLRTQVVLIDDIYNQFNAGIADPQAIRAFLAWTLGNWQEPVPAYVLLLGDGHFDPRGYATSQPQFIPPDLRTLDPWLGEVADENHFVSVVGDDDIPDLLLGRLPVRTAEEAALVIAKIKTFEQADPQEPWQGAMLLVADDPDTAGDFHALADAVAAQFEPLLKIYRYYWGGNYGNSHDLRHDLLAAWSQGARFINYIGHGQPSAWAGEQLLRVEDLAQLQNRDKPSFLLAMASLTGVYYDVGSQSLQEEMLTLPDKRGVAAYVASTGFGIASGNALINQGILEAILYQRAQDAGTAMLLAKLHLFAQGYFYTEFLTELYTLFGDPAMRIPQAPWPGMLYLPLSMHDRS